MFGFNAYLFISITLHYCRFTYQPIKPDLISKAHLVEVQVGFIAVRVAKEEYVLLHKLRAICILDKVVELVSDNL